MKGASMWLDGCLSQHWFNNKYHLRKTYLIVQSTHVDSKYNYTFVWTKKLEREKKIRIQR